MAESNIQFPAHWDFLLTSLVTNMEYGIEVGYSMRRAKDWKYLNAAWELDF